MSLSLIGVGNGLVLVCPFLVCQDFLLVAVGPCLTLPGGSTLSHCRRQQRELILQQR